MGTCYTRCSIILLCISSLLQIGLVHSRLGYASEQLTKKTPPVWPPQLTARKIVGMTRVDHLTFFFDDLQTFHVGPFVLHVALCDTSTISHIDHLYFISKCGLLAPDVNIVV